MAEAKIRELTNYLNGELSRYHTLFYYPTDESMYRELNAEL